MDNDKLNIHLYNFGYETAPITPGFWQHQKCPLQLSLVMDGFGVKYDLQADITHLLDTQKKCTIYLRTDMERYTVD